MFSRVRVTRRSLTLAAAAATLAGAPLLAASAASAGGVGTVTFSGGCGLLGSGLGANSTPDTAQVSVPVGSGVRFANRLGQAATLRLDGEAAAQVPAGGSAEVVFHDGPVSASMQVSCLLGEPAGTVTVEVSSGQAGPPGGGAVDPSPAAPTHGGGDPAPANPPSSRSAGSGAGTPSQGGPTSGPGWPAGDPSGGGWGPGVAAPPPAGQPADVDSQDSGSGTPNRSGERQPRWGVEIEPADGGATYGDPATVDAESAGAGLATDQLSRTSGSTSDDGPVGLLALIATVCVVGVSAGAARALITQRANRAEWA